jgi:hypothetical protein
MKTLWNYSNYNNDIRITRQDAAKCSHSGDCESDIIELLQKPYIKKQVATLDREQLKKELSEYGAWNEAELRDHNQNIIRWLWLSAADIIENH